jgi:hypothetical protein
MVSSGLLRRVALVRTTRKTQFFIVTAVKTSNLTILAYVRCGHIPQHRCVYSSRILVFYDGDYEEWRLLGCYAVWLL